MIFLSLRACCAQMVGGGINCVVECRCRLWRRTFPAFFFSSFSFPSRNECVIENSSSLKLEIDDLVLRIAGTHQNQAGLVDLSRWSRMDPALSRTMAMATDVFVRKDVIACWTPSSNTVEAVRSRFVIR